MKLRALSTIVMIIMGWILGAGCEADDGDDQRYRELPMANCGPAYELVDPSTLGQVVDWDEDSMWDLSKESYENLASTSGLEVLTPVRYGVRMFRFRYTTQDRGTVVEATGTLALPQMDPAPDEALPTLLVFHGTSGYSDACAPSLEMLSVHQFFAGYAAAMGYITVYPDYIGMTGFGAPSTASHAFFNGEQIAIGSWDAVRAAQRLLRESLDTPLLVDGRVLLWGVSQGGHGALFAERYAPYYAPEFTVPGVVAATAPLGGEFLASIFGVDAGFTTPAILASVLVSHARWTGEGDVAEILTNDATRFYADNFEETLFSDTTCPLGVYPPLEITTHEELLSEALLSALREDRLEDVQPWGCYIREANPHATSVPALRSTPTLVIYGTEDSIVPPASQRDTFDALCAEGQQIQYLECAQAAHIDTFMWSLPEQMAWLDDRAAGVALPTTDLCDVGLPVCCSGSPSGTCTP